MGTRFWCPLAAPRISSSESKRTKTRSWRPDMETQILPLAEVFGHMTDSWYSRIFTASLLIVQFLVERDRVKSGHEEGRYWAETNLLIINLPCVEISARAIIQAKYHVCWGPLQTHKDTIMRIRPLKMTMWYQPTRPPNNRSTEHSHFQTPCQCDPVYRCTSRNHDPNMPGSGCFVPSSHDSRRLWQIIICLLNPFTTAGSKNSGGK